MTSTNGTTWISRTSAADNDWNAVCWSPELGVFVAVADSGTGNRVMSSINGTTWVLDPTGVDNNWFGLCWSPDLMIFAAVAWSGTLDRAMISKYVGGAKYYHKSYGKASDVNTTDGPWSLASGKSLTGRFTKIDNVVTFHYAGVSGVANQTKPTIPYDMAIPLEYQMAIGYTIEQPAALIVNNQEVSGFLRVLGSSIAFAVNPTVNSFVSGQIVGYHPGSAQWNTSPLIL
jgi:hypothetical protein